MARVRAEAAEAEAGSLDPEFVELYRLAGAQTVLDVEFTGPPKPSHDDEYVTIPIAVRGAPVWHTELAEAEVTSTLALIDKSWAPAIGSTTSVGGWVIDDAAAADAFQVPIGTLKVVVAVPGGAVGRGPARHDRLWRAWSEAAAGRTTRAQLVQLVKAAHALKGRDSADDPAARLLGEVLDTEFGADRPGRPSAPDTSAGTQLPTTVEDLAPSARKGLRDRHFVVDVDPRLHSSITYVAVRFADGRETAPNDIDEQYGFADIISASPVSRTLTVPAWTAAEPQPDGDVVLGEIKLTGNPDSAVLQVSGASAADASVSLVESGGDEVAQGWVTSRVQ